MNVPANGIAENVRVLEELHSIVSRLDSEHYAGTGGLPVASGPGGHVRHILDAYDCLVRDHETGRVDFTARERDPLTATDPVFATGRIERTVCALRRLRLSASTSLAVRAEDTAGGAWCASSVGRELQSLLSHTIHHLALVALVLRLRGVEPGESFGVAPSTLAHWRKAS
ncbi:MAG: hypothetical protein IPF53_16250 [Blastocatellia bacterium]|nr:hypothetical protein [Blastocatellia bacterium]